MSSYLQRLLGRAAPGIATSVAPSVPIAPLSSPLAAHDQRLGLPNFEAPVPSEFEGPKLIEPALTSEARTEPTTKKPIADEASIIAPRPAPELRLVGERHVTSAQTDATPHPIETAPPTPTQIETSAFARVPLEIGPDELQPIPVSVAALAEPFERDVSEDRNHFEPTSRSKSPFTEPEPSFDPEIPDLPAETGEEAAALPTADPPRPVEPTARQLVPIMPVPLDEADPAPLSIALTPDTPEPADKKRNLLSPAFDQPNEAREAAQSVNIEQIVIDVHEPQPVRAEQGVAARGPPATAAAASIIGALPVRRSTVSLFGMRRR